MLTITQYLHNTTTQQRQDEDDYEDKDMKYLQPSPRMSDDQVEMVFLVENQGEVPHSVWGPHTSNITPTHLPITPHLYYNHHTPIL